MELIQSLDGILWSVSMQKFHSKSFWSGVYRSKEGMFEFETTLKVKSYRRLKKYDCRYIYFSKFQILAFSVSCQKREAVFVDAQEN